MILLAGCDFLSSSNEVKLKHDNPELVTYCKHVFGDDSFTYTAKNLKVYYSGSTIFFHITDDQHWLRTMTPVNLGNYKCKAME